MKVHNILLWRMDGEEAYFAVLPEKNGNEIIWRFPRCQEPEDGEMTLNEIIEVALRSELVEVGAPIYKFLNVSDLKSFTIPGTLITQYFYLVGPTDDHGRLRKIQTYGAQAEILGPPIWMNLLGLKHMLLDPYSKVLVPLERIVQSQFQ